jgi:phage internal scaffolding protein
MSYGIKWEPAPTDETARCGYPLVDYDRWAIDASPVEGEPGAMQQFRDQCDINNIMRRYQRTGALEWATKHEGTYADVTGITFQSAQDQLLRAEQLFADLPSSIRDRFANDPGAFLDFIHDSSNRDEAIRLGLIPEPAAVAPVVPEAAGPA